MQAVRDDYKRRSMCLLCQDALEILREIKHGPVRCGYIGGRLFWDAAHHRGSAPFTRIAGKVLKRLEHAGLAEWQRNQNFGGWVVTAAGRICDYHGETP